MVYLCYVDESGGYEAPDSCDSATPVMAFVGLVVPAKRIPAFTRDFLALKRRHYPKRFEQGPGLSHILSEVKGTDLLWATRHKSRDRRRQADRVRSEVLDLIEIHECKIVGRVYVKSPGDRLDPIPSYSFAIQDMARHFSTFLVSQGDRGLMICDAREQSQNVSATHSVFTDKFRTGGDPVSALMDIPVFGHSDNHAALQVCDIVASAFILPMAASAYCDSTTKGRVHGSRRYDALAATFGE